MATRVEALILPSHGVVPHATPLEQAGLALGAFFQNQLSIDATSPYQIEVDLSDRPEIRLIWIGRDIVRITQGGLGWTAGQERIDEIQQLCGAVMEIATAPQRPPGSFQEITHTLITDVPIIIDKLRRLKLLEATLQQRDQEIVVLKRRLLPPPPPPPPPVIVPPPPAPAPQSLPAYLKSLQITQKDKPWVVTNLIALMLHDQGIDFSKTTVSLQMIQDKLDELGITDCQANSIAQTLEKNKSLIKSDWTTYEKLKGEKKDLSTNKRSINTIRAYFDAQKYSRLTDKVDAKKATSLSVGDFACLSLRLVALEKVYTAIRYLYTNIPTYGSDTDIDQHVSTIDYKLDMLQEVRTILEGKLQQLG